MSAYLHPTTSHIISRTVQREESYLLAPAVLQGKERIDGRPSDELEDGRHLAMDERSQGTRRSDTCSPCYFTGSYDTASRDPCAAYSSSTFGSRIST
jgi:hypothetical protein